MKKIIALNCSPREDGNTAQVLKSALAGAAEAGAETRLVHLGSMNFSGCRSCFVCKLKNSPAKGVCAYSDALTPLLKEIGESCDGLIIGTPIYFGAESGICRNLAERLFFPVLSYDDFGTSMARRKFPIAFVYTMNVTEENAKDFKYPERTSLLAKYGARMFSEGKMRTLYVCDTWQFDDYSRYSAAGFDVEHKAEVRRTKFPAALQKAKEMGKELAAVTV